MHVQVDKTGHYIFARCIYRLICLFFQLCPDFVYDTIFNIDVRNFVCTGRRVQHTTALNHQ